MKKLNFNSSDAWLMLAISFASQQGTATLKTIIEVGDGIDHAIFKPEELESGLARLTEAGYVVERAGVFYPTEKVQPYAESFLAKRRSMDKRLKDVQEMLGAPSALDDQLSRNDDSDE
jgi:hypothetical protein